MTKLIGFACKCCFYTYIYHAIFTAVLHQKQFIPVSQEFASMRALCWTGIIFFAFASVKELLRRGFTIAFGDLFAISVVHEENPDPENNTQDPGSAL